jgi:hypothetical protein
MDGNTAQALATYFESWKANDFATLRSVLAEDVDFVGPLGRANGVEECQQGLERMSQIKTDIVILETFVDGSDAPTWFELHTSVAPPTPVANWSRVENGKITSIRVTFDPRVITAQSG